MIICGIETNNFLEKIVWLMQKIHLVSTGLFVTGFILIGQFLSISTKFFCNVVSSYGLAAGNVNCLSALLFLVIGIGVITAGAVFAFIPKK